MKGLDCIYQDMTIMEPLIGSLQALCEEDEKVIWRSAFRWMDSQGVLSNHFEGNSLAALAEDFGYDIVANFNHVAVVRRRKP